MHIVSGVIATFLWTVNKRIKWAISMGKITYRKNVLWCSEAEIILVRYCNKGKLSNRFLALRNVDRANAENITRVVEDSLTKVGGIPHKDVYKKAVGWEAFMR